MTGEQVIGCMGNVVIGWIRDWTGGCTVVDRMGLMESWMGYWLGRYLGCV